jgi:hypothetical protein
VICTILCLGQRFVLRCFEFGAALFELRQIRGGGALGLAVGNQKVTCVTVFHLDHIAEGAEVDNFFKQYDLHICSLVQVGVVQQA